MGTTSKMAGTTSITEYYLTNRSNSISSRLEFRMNFDCHCSWHLASVSNALNTAWSDMKYSSSPILYVANKSKSINDSQDGLLWNYTLMHHEPHDQNRRLGTPAHHLQHTRKNRCLSTFWMPIQQSWLNTRELLLESRTQLTIWAVWSICCPWLPRMNSHVQRWSLEFVGNKRGDGCISGGTANLALKAMLLHAIMKLAKKGKAEEAQELNTPLLGASV